jgi:hypothetical protein
MSELMAGKRREEFFRTRGKADISALDLYKVPAFRSLFAPSTLVYTSPHSKLQHHHCNHLAQRHMTKSSKKGMMVNIGEWQRVLF